MYSNIFGRPLKQRLPMLHDRMVNIYDQTKDKVKQLVNSCLYFQKSGQLSTA